MRSTEMQMADGSYDDGFGPKETDEELFARARAHMEKYWAAASLDRRLWDATVRLVLKGQECSSGPSRDSARLDWLEKTLHIDGTGDIPVFAMFIPGSEEMMGKDWDLRRMIDESMPLAASCGATSEKT